MGNCFSNGLAICNKSKHLGAHGTLVGTLILVENMQKEIFLVWTVIMAFRNGEIIYLFNF
jgi:hypothetical protein